MISRDIDGLRNFVEGSRPKKPGSMTVYFEVSKSL